MGSSKSKGLEAFKSYGRGGSFKIQGIIQSQEVGVSVKSQGGGRHLRDSVCVWVEVGKSFKSQKVRSNPGMGE